MSPSPRRLRAALALVLAASLPQCASAPSAAPVVAPAVTAPSSVELAVDTSPVDRPADAVLSVRIGSVRGAARRLGEMLGLRDFVEEALTSALPDILGDEGAARAIDIDGPLDLLVALHDNDVEGIASLPIRSLATAREQLADGHTLEAFGDPSLRIQRVRRSGSDRSRDDLLLIPGGSAGAGRLLMVHRREGNEGFVNRYAAYLTRTLAAQPLGSDDGAAVVELHPQVIEGAMRADLDRLMVELVNEASPGQDPNNPLFADAARAWLRDFFGALRSSIAESRGARLSLGLGDQGATLHFDVALQSPSAQLAQQALGALRDSSAPMDLYERLPPGGWSYSAWALHAEPLRATLNLGASAAARMVSPRTRLPEADATALRTALGALVAQDRVAVASTTSRDPQERYTSTALLRLSTPSPQFVANVRTLVNTLRRPAVARAMRADLNINPMGWTLPPVTGLPTGSLLLRGPMPSLTELAAAVRSTAPTPAPRTATAARPAPPARPVLSELLLVPEGDHVWVVLGANARTQFQSASGSHAPPPSIADAAAAGTSSVVAILPSMLTEAFRNDTSLLRMVRDAIAHGGEGATAASVGRLQMSEREGVTHVSADLTVPRSALGLVGQSVQRGLARP